MTKPNNRERIRDLENQLEEMRREMKMLRDQVSGGRSPFQNVRIIDNGDSPAGNAATNVVCEFLDVKDHTTTPATIKRSANSGYNVWRIPGHDFTPGPRPKVVFFYSGYWYEFPMTPGAGLFITNAVIPAYDPDAVGGPKLGVGAGIRQTVATDGTLTATSDNLVLYNSATEIVAGGALVQAKQEIGGKWLVDYEDCPEAS